MAFGLPAASMGFVGFVRLITNEGNYILRVSSCNLGLSQAIDMMDVIDSRYDKTAYVLRPLEAGGDISFPAVFDPQGGVEAARSLYEHCISRNNSTGKLSPFDIDVRYGPAASYPTAHDFNYKNCVLDSWNFSVSAGEEVTIDTSLMAEQRIEPGAESGTYSFNPFSEFNFSDLTSEDSTERENTRVITWNDCSFVMDAGHNFSGESINGSWMRSFDVSISNALERIYTLNRKLFPQDIVPKKRDVTGSMTIMGRHDVLASLARTNYLRGYEDSTITFGFKPSNSTVSESFGVKLPNVIFQIEDMSMTNDLLESTVNFISMPAAGTFSEFSDPLANTNADLTDY